MLPGPYDAQTAQTPQQLDWTCSCRTAYWMLKSLGGTDGPDVIAEKMLAAGLVTPELGLLDGSGAQLSRFLADESGYPAHSRYPVSWEALADLPVGAVPVGMGGAAWYHWTGVREWDSGGLALANSAEAWQGVGQWMSAAEYAAMGPFAVVWIDSGEEDALSAEERAELEGYRQAQPYYDTALGTVEAPGGLVGQALGTMEEAATVALNANPGGEAAALANVVLGQCTALREQLGL